MFGDTNILPSLASYKLQCQDSSKSWLAYQVSIKEVQLVDFSSNGAVRQSLIITVPEEPIKSIRIVYDPEQKTVYVAVVLLYKFMVFKKNQIIQQFALPLDCNVVDYSTGFTAADGINDKRQIYFVFVTSKAKIITFPVSTPENKVILQIQTNQRISSLCARQTYTFLGTQKGQILRVDLNTRKILGTYRTGNQFPVINIKIFKEYLIAGTCNGELHILSMNLQKKRVLSAHQGMIGMMMIQGTKMVTVGDDSVLRVWQMDGEGILTQVKQQIYDKRPNLLFSIHGVSYVNFYEEITFQEV